MGKTSSYGNITQNGRWDLFIISSIRLIKMLSDSYSNIGSEETLQILSLTLMFITETAITPSYS